MIALQYELWDVPHNRSGKFKNGYTPTDISRAILFSNRNIIVIKSKVNF